MAMLSTADAPGVLLMYQLQLCSPCCDAAEMDQSQECHFQAVLFTLTDEHYDNF